MAKDSVQQKISRVRAPRVHITYDVEVGDAVEVKELPFVLGVLGEFTGQPTEAREKLSDSSRRFTEINPDNFDSVLKSMKPHLAYSVGNQLSDDPEAGRLAVDLNFESLEDFEPEQVARKVKPISDLIDVRTKLQNLRATMQGNEKFEDLLMEAVSNTDKLAKLGSELDLSKPGGGSK